MKIFDKKKVEEKPRVGRPGKEYPDKIEGYYTSLTGKKKDDLMDIEDEILDATHDTPNKRCTRIVNVYILNWNKNKKGRKK